jgi:predicted transcriptional regulator
MVQRVIRVRTRFNAPDFGAAVYRRMREQHMTFKTVEQVTGVPAPTVVRITNGRPPNVDNLVALCHWGGWDLRSFMVEGISHV